MSPTLASQAVTPSGADRALGACMHTSNACSEAATPRMPAPPPVDSSTSTAGSPSTVASEKWYCWHRMFVPAGRPSRAAAGGWSVAKQ
eukprot:3628606-Rhodomonas_salina.1